MFRAGIAYCNPRPSIILVPAVDSVGLEAHVELEFGSIEGDDLNVTFGDLRGVQAASDGTIYVLDEQAAEVRSSPPGARRRSRHGSSSQTSASTGRAARRLPRDR